MSNMDGRQIFSEQPASVVAGQSPRAMKKILKRPALLVAALVRPLLCGRSFKRLLLRLAAFVLFPEKKLVLHGWPTILNFNNLEIGLNCSINQGVFIQARSRVVLGNHVTLSPSVLILDAGLQPGDIASGAASKEHYSAPVVIEDHVWVGAGAIILAGVKIGRQSVVGAGAVVTANVPPFSVVAGVPARVIKQIEASNPGASAILK
jgi:acetyltransferase-like isoleucine patch superfamily enzyme